MLLRIAVILLLGLVIFNKFNSIQLNITIEGLTSKIINNRTVGFLCLILILSYFNWFFEVKKWGILVNNNKTKVQHWKSILIGNLMGIITPGRIGEYAGRAIASQDIGKVQAVYANFLCSLAQNICNFLPGIPLMYYLTRRVEIFGSTVDFIFFILAILTSVFMVIIFLNQKFLIAWITQLKKYADLLHLSEVIIPRQSTNFQLLFWSTLRYLVYSFQYYLALLAFSTEIEVQYALAGIGAIYIYKSLMPLPSAFGIVLRVQLAILIWGKLSPYLDGVILASLTIWLFNQLLPAVIGLPSFWKATQQGK